MTKCYSIPPEIQEWIDIVESETYAVSEDQKLLIDHVKQCFAEEKIYVDTDQLQGYIGLSKYFSFETVFPWQKFVIGLHDCTYTEDGEPRWPDLLCMLGRGAGKDGTIAWESLCLTSPYNGIKDYDVDICANNEDQATRPLKDLIEAFEEPKNLKKMKKFFYWTKEQAKSLKTGSVIKGRTNSPKGKDGLRSGICIFNEIHQYEDYKNINVFTTGLGKKKHPRRSYYTTNGDVEEGPLDDLLEKADRILRQGEPDRGLLPFICRLDAKEEVHDERNWPKANPSLPYLRNLYLETKKEYEEWKANPAILPAFMTKRMNVRDRSGAIAVTDYENIKATNVELPDLMGKTCTCGIDFVKVTDFAAVDLHFREGDIRYDINHTWVCKKSRDLPRIKAPLDEWERQGLLTYVDDVEIHPSVITDYIAEMSKYYNIVKIAIDDFRYALLTSALKEIGFDAKDRKNVKLVKQLDIMRIVPVIDSCFANHNFVWGNNPVLRWATNNAKLIQMKRRTVDDKEMGNYVYGKIEPKSRKTDPFMALVAGMVIEEEIPVTAGTPPDIGLFLF